ncbi:8006_t:CDS:2 [Gigaspora margarita]|uniref:8006_t:CDS:1 n=1 Tax=Gigaspora margarita TaxID=4874 RepID=A0ABN7VRG2_GIGMA|nr:8006_t:CDS:2 [Gigaspora margarita]
MNTSRNPRSNRYKGLPNIPFQYHEAYDDRYRTAGRDTYFVNDEYIENEENEQSEISSSPIPKRNTFIIDERSENDEYEESNPESIISSPNNDRPPSPPLSPKKNNYELIDENSKISQSPIIINNNDIEKSLPQLDYQSQQKRKNYFNLSKTLTSRFKFKKPNNNVKDIQDRSFSSEKSQSLLSSLPTLVPSSPISHQFPADYLSENIDKDEDTKSVERNNNELTIDDLYHFVLNVQKVINSVTNVRSVTRQMEKHGAGRWFHNENDDYIS